jgi:SagB-type dehydrogenase family enzyme
VSTTDDGSGSAPHEESPIALPRPVRDGSLSVERALLGRRSVREFSATPLTTAEVGQLLWAAQGISGAGLRTAPSAGATYPLEVVLVAGEIDGVPTGVYRYRSLDHSLALLARGDRRADVAAAALVQTWLAQAPALLLVSAVLERTAARYGRRARRYVDQEVGCAAENVALQAVALGLGTTMVGAFDDAGLARVIGLQPGEEPLCLLPVGRPWRT